MVGAASTYINASWWSRTAIFAFMMIIIIIMRNKIIVIITISITVTASRQI